MALVVEGRGVRGRGWGCMRLNRELALYLGYLQQSWIELTPGIWDMASLTVDSKGLPKLLEAR